MPPPAEPPIAFLDLTAGLAELAPAPDQAFARVRDRGSFVLGEEVERFEQEFAEHCGVRECVGVGSGLDALQLLLRAAGIGPGDEVLVPAYTAVATWMAVSLVGATPIGVDVDAATYNLDAEAAARAIGSRTKAIVPVHLFGHPAEMEPILTLGEENGLRIFEDAAQAHGARRHGRRVGGLADAAAFSFYPTKNLGALGDGGAVATDDPEIAERVRLLRAYGWRERGVSEIKGVNSRLDELQAALLRVKLARLDEWNERRRALASRYLELLGDLPGLSLPWPRPEVEPVWHLFVVGSPRRESLKRHLHGRRIGSLVHYDPLPHLTPAYQADGWGEGDFPVAERLAREALSLPLFPQLEPEAVDRVAAHVRDEVAVDRAGRAA